MAIEIARRLLSIDEYHKMVQAEILTADDKVELIHGEIIQMSPIGSKHAALVDKLSNYLAFSLYEKAIVRTQNPIQLLPNSEPEPDISILKYKPDFYQEQHPKAADTLWVIEVAKGSYEFDAVLKAALYAKAGIPEYWIITLNKDQIEVFRMPNAEGYQQQETYAGPSIIEHPTLAVQVDTQKLFL